MRRVRMDDIARLAGVSTATVSRVINGNASVSEKTREKVQRIIEQFDYHPNAVARATASKRSYTWGLIVPYKADFVFLNPFFSEVLRGVSQAANKFGYHLLFVYAREGLDYASLYKEQRVDGLILISPRVEDEGIVNLIHYNIPFVSTSRIPYGGCWVDIDNVKAGFTATNYLVQQGHRRIGYINGPEEMASSSERLEGYRLALNVNGIPFEEDYVFPGQHRKEDGYACIERYLALKEPPTGVFAASDLMGIGLLQGAKARGLQVPKDISVIGFDDIPFALDVDPPLTTIRQPAYLKGLIAGGMLRNILMNRPVKQRKILPTEIVLRGSVAVRN